MDFSIICSTSVRSSTLPFTTTTSRGVVCSAYRGLLVRLKSMKKWFFLRLVRVKRRSITCLNSCKKIGRHVQTWFVSSWSPERPPRTPKKDKVIQLSTSAMSPPRTQIRFQQSRSSPVQPSLLPGHRMCKDGPQQPACLGQAVDVSGSPSSQKRSYLPTPMDGVLGVPSI